MLVAFSTPRNRTIAFVFLTICCVFATGAGFVGISDNPPGIFLVFGAAAAFILAFVHPWRTSKQYRRLLYASLIGFVIFAVLHNGLHAIGNDVSDGLLKSLLQGLNVTSFLIAVLICPPALLVGAVGAIVFFIHNRRKIKQGVDEILCNPEQQ